MTTALKKLNINLIQFPDEVLSVFYVWKTDAQRIEVAQMHRVSVTELEIETKNPQPQLSHINLSRY